VRRVLTIAVVVSVFVVAVRVGGDDPNPYAQAATKGASVELVQGKGVVWWSRRAVQARKDANARARTIRRLKQVVAGDTTIQNAIDLAAIAYNVSASTLSRKASCESTGGHGYNPNAASTSSSARGLFEFLTRGRVHRYGDHVLVDGGTWATTPYWMFSPYNPLAAALAAGWMHAHGRGGEWVCR
jgi:hypothetical protein